jgi:hypothetical protein
VTPTHEPHPPLSSHGTENRIKPCYSSSERSRSGRSTPCATDSDIANEYRLWKLMWLWTSGEKRATSAESMCIPSARNFCSAAWPAHHRAPYLQRGHGARRRALWQPLSCQSVGHVPARRHTAVHGDAHNCPSRTVSQALLMHAPPCQACAGTCSGRRASRPREVSGIWFAHTLGSTGVWPLSYRPHQRQNF